MCALKKKNKVVNSFEDIFEDKKLAKIVKAKMESEGTLFPEKVKKAKDILSRSKKRS